jgi:hypothetical protein
MDSISLPLNFQSRWGLVELDFDQKSIVLVERMELEALELVYLHIRVLKELQDHHKEEESLNFCSGRRYLRLKSGAIPRAAAGQMTVENWRDESHSRETQERIGKQHPGNSGREEWTHRCQGSLTLWPRESATPINSTLSLKDEHGAFSNDLRGERGRKHRAILD